MAAEEVDKELMVTARDRGFANSEYEGLSAEIRAFLKNKNETGTKGDTWALIAEMAGFSMGGFGFFKTRLGMGAYNRERKATILRQFIADKDALWGGGLRFPIGNRVAHASAALTWGAMNPDKPGDDVLTMADCLPFTYEAFDSFTIDGKKFETWGKPPQTIDAFTRAAKRHVELFSLFFGRENAAERLEAITVFRQIHEAQPEVFHLHFLISAWEAMTYRYISEVMGGAPRLMRIPPKNVRKTECRRNALSPGVHGQPRWEFPTTWLMDHHTGYWQSIAIRKMEEQISKSARRAVLHQPAKALRAAGGTLPADTVFAKPMSVKDKANP